MSALTEILDTFRKTSQTEREKGNYFENLAKLYFQNEPRYNDLYSNVWLWEEWRNEWIKAGHTDPGTDTGIDLVAKNFKPTDQIIEQQHSFFSSLKSIRQILVMGHSLSEVDAPYLKEIVRNIDSSTVTWKVSYHSDPTDAQNKLSTLGVDLSLATFSRLNDVHAWKY